MSIYILPCFRRRERELVWGDSHDGAVAAVHCEHVECELSADEVDKEGYSCCAVQEGSGVFGEGMEVEVIYDSAGDVDESLFVVVRMSVPSTWGG